MTVKNEGLYIGTLVLDAGTAENTEATDAEIFSIIMVMNMKFQVSKDRGRSLGFSYLIKDDTIYMDTL